MAWLNGESGAFDRFIPSYTHSVFISQLAKPCLHCTHSTRCTRTRCTCWLQRYTLHLITHNTTTQHTAATIGSSQVMLPGLLDEVCCKTNRKFHSQTLNARDYALWYRIFVKATGAHSETCLVDTTKCNVLPRKNPSLTQETLDVCYSFSCLY